jgi:TolB-like protein
MTSVAEGQDGRRPESIVVLPFTNAALDLEQEYFAEGITEDLTTDLSRIPGSFVIAPSTAFTYKGKPIDVRQIGRELSVRYALQGSVRRIVDSVRVNAQLVDTASASQVWAERYDGEIAQLAKVQDWVTRHIAGELKVAHIEAESQRASRERLDNPNAVDLTMRGSALVNKRANRESIQHARELFEAALRLSPEYLPALDGLGNAARRHSRITMCKLIRRDVRTLLRMLSTSGDDPVRGRTDLAAAVGGYVRKHHRPFTREDAQFFHWHAELLTPSTHSEQGN